MNIVTHRLEYVTTVAIVFDPMHFGIARDDTPDDLGALVQEHYRDALVTWLEERVGADLVTHYTLRGTYADCEGLHDLLDGAATTPDDVYPIIPVVVYDEP